MTVRERDNPGHQALGRNFHPATAARSRILHYALAPSIDVTFPGQSEPDQVDVWISAYSEPFYIRP